MALLAKIQASIRLLPRRRRIASASLYKAWASCNWRAHSATRRLQRLTGGRACRRRPVARVHRLPAPGHLLRPFSRGATEGWHDSSAPLEGMYGRWPRGRLAQFDDGMLGRRAILRLQPPGGTNCSGGQIGVSPPSSASSSPCSRITSSSPSLSPKTLYRVPRRRRASTRPPCCPSAQSCGLGSQRSLLQRTTLGSPMIRKSALDDLGSLGG